MREKNGLRFRPGTMAAIFAVGVGAGVIFAPGLIFAVPMMTSDMSVGAIISLSVTAGVLFLPVFAAFSIRPKPGTAIAVGAITGVIVGLLTPYTLDSILSFLLVGVIAEVPLWFCRGQALSSRQVIYTGTGIGLIQFTINIIGHSITLHPVHWILLLLLTL
ncbi:MAG: hypothetical protein AAF787_04205, partial [Chloroflexota bacterium]